MLQPVSSDRPPRVSERCRKARRAGCSMRRADQLACFGQRGIGIDAGQRGALEAVHAALPARPLQHRQQGLGHQRHHHQVHARRSRPAAAMRDEVDAARRSRSRPAARAAGRTAPTSTAPGPTAPAARCRPSRTGRQAAAPGCSDAGRHATACRAARPSRRARRRAAKAERTSRPGGRLATFSARYTSAVGSQQPHRREVPLQRTAEPAARASPRPETGTGRTATRCRCASRWSISTSTASALSQWLMRIHSGWMGCRRETLAA